MLRCFDDALLANELMDRRPFTLTHKLLGHPSLSLENLARALPTLPSNQVFYSRGLLSEADDFDQASSQHCNGMSLEETIDKIRSSDSYIMVRAPEVDASFRDLHRSLCDDISQVMNRSSLGDVPIDPMLYLFIASPNSVTPFHIDRYSTLLLQFRGIKTVHVCEPWDARAVDPVEREAYVAYADRRPTWRADVERFSTPFRFSPGEALHIPFVSGHFVRNGANDVSISMSIIFKTPVTLNQSRAMCFNHMVRSRLHWNPEPVGTSRLLDSAKAATWRVTSGITRRLRAPAPAAAT